MKIILHSLAAFLIAMPAVAQKPSSIRFTAHVNQGVHKLADRLPIEIKIENIGDDPVYVFGNLDYFIMLFATTADGKDLPTNSIRQTLAPPPTRESFTRLEPGHFLGKVWNENLKTLGIRKSGRYHLELEYRSNYSPEFSYGLPVWNGRQSVSLDVVISR